MPAPSKRPITAEDLYAFQILSGVRMAPDGKRVVFCLQRVDRKSEKKYANLWVASTAGGEAQQFTWGDQTDTQPSWSPDGRWIAFLSNRRNPEKPPQIYLIPTDGGEARPLTDFPGEISSFAWSPDSKRLVCVARKSDPEILQREKDEQKKKLGVVARHYDRVFYKLDGSGYLPKERWHLWTIEAQSGKMRQLTNHPVYDERDPAWSPDGKWIAFISNRTPQPDLNYAMEDVFLVPARGGEIRRLETPAGHKGLPSFSPDGKWIAYLGSEDLNAWYKNRALYLVPVDGSRPAVNISERYDLHLEASIINDIGSPETMPPVWSQDGQRLYVQAARRGSVILISISREGEALEVIIPEGGVVGSFSFDQTQEKLAYFYGQSHDPAQVTLMDMATRQTRQLTQLNRNLLDQLDLGELEEVWFQGPEGNPLQGWILKPPGFDPNKRYPSILEIHGGPWTQYGWFFMHEFYFLAAHGYVVYFSNPRGGRGYGEAHAAAIWENWGGPDYADLMAWADYVEKLPYIDPDRMGVTGGSYGGYMTVWIIGHTARFKAAVTQRCVSNLISFWGSTDFNWIWQEVFGGKPPFENFEKFWQHSPIRYIGNATTPTLVIHNENDLRCPIEQGEQVFVALQRKGVPSEMVRFPEESHGLSRTGRTDRRIARLNHILGWFNRYLKGPDAE